MTTPESGRGFQEGSSELPPELSKLIELMDSAAETDDDRLVAANAREALSRFFNQARNAHEGVFGATFAQIENVEGQNVYALPVGHTGIHWIRGENKLVFSEEYQQRLLKELGVYKYLNLPEDLSVGRALGELYVRKQNKRAADAAIKENKWINYGMRRDMLMEQSGVFGVSFVGYAANKESKYENKYDLSGAEFQGVSPISYDDRGEQVGFNSAYTWTEGGKLTRRDEGRALRLLLSPKTVESWFKGKE